MIGNFARKKKVKGREALTKDLRISLSQVMEMRASESFGYETVYSRKVINL